jgi:phosphoserine phosphatase RsbU/P
MDYGPFERISRPVIDSLCRGPEDSFMSDDVNQLKKRIRELEEEVQHREEDLSRFRAELVTANGQLEHLINQVQRELKMAQSIYRSLVPTEFPHISGFEFSTKFVPSMISGGDYFDIFEHQDRMRFGVVLSSASGHSLSALLLSLESELIEHFEDSSQLDLFYAVVDRRKYVLNFVRVGEVMVFHQLDDGSLRILGEKNPSIKKGQIFTGQTEQVALSPRDRLVVVSPGCVRAQNLRGEAFGWERVSQSIKSSPQHGVHELRQNLLFEIEKFSEGSELKRDLTILAIEVKDKVIKLAPTK